MTVTADTITDEDLAWARRYFESVYDTNMVVWCEKALGTRGTRLADAAVYRNAKVVVAKAIHDAVASGASITEILNLNGRNRNKEQQ